MDDVQLLKIRLHPGQTDRFVAFARGLMDRSAEVQASLRLEGIRLETLFVERTARPGNHGHHHRILGHG